MSRQSSLPASIVTSPVHLVVPEGATSLEAEAARLLEERFSAQTGVPVQTVAEAPPHAAGGFTILLGQPGLATALQPPDQPEGYALHTGPGRAALVASEARGLLYGVGRLLRLLDTRDGRTLLPQVSETTSPACPERGVYLATHFNNWYECAPLEDVERYVEDLALWGINTLWTWFDMNWHRAGFWDDADSRGSRMVARLRHLNTVARRLGMRVGLTGIANEGFSHQPPPELRAHPGAQRGGFYPYSHICPSAPGGWEMILHNRRRILDLIGPIDAYWHWPYDQGGCGCTRCADADGWTRTFLALGRDIARLVRERSPGVEFILSTWYMNDAELALVQAEAARPDRWFDGVLLETRRAGHVTFPPGLRLSVFPEISMFDTYFVSYGCNGANPAPRRFVPEAARIARSGHGAVLYSEGCYEDLNKWVWAACLWDPQRSVDDVVGEYCRYHFGQASEALASELILGLEETWGVAKLSACDPAEPPRLLDQAERLRHACSGNWRADVLWHRARLDALMKAIGPDRELLAEAKRLWDQAAFADDGEGIRQQARALLEAVTTRQASVQALFTAYWEYMRAFHLQHCTLAFRPDDYLGAADLTGLRLACEEALRCDADAAFRETLIRGLHRWLWQSKLGLDFLFL